MANNPAPPPLPPTAHLAPTVSVEPPRDVGAPLPPGPWRPPFWPREMPFPDRQVPNAATFPPTIDPKSLPVPKNPLPEPKPMENAANNFVLPYATYTVYTA